MAEISNSTPPPAWNAAGILPPIRETSESTGHDRSPYRCDLMSLIERFGTSPVRCKILKGFLEYRLFLHGLGITEGFQWVNGSFVEDKERRRGEPPKDIDVVTYFRKPITLTKSSLNEEQTKFLFDPHSCKQKFHVDGLIMPFGEASNESFIEDTAYWLSLFSHTREGVWKGFLHVPLGAGGEAEAAEYLQRTQSAS